MKQMTLIEMDGFLKGKCIPRDLKVNETNAEYLVRKFAEAEAKCAALAAENAAMHETIAAVRSVADNSSGISGWHLNGDIATWEEILPEINDIETPATDALLAEVRAQGVEMFAECAYTLEHHDHAVAFAAELRKGDRQ
ncbi:hypothetical protein [Escherichia sp. Marseille-Q3837]|uniref:hypothetical protein n=1 Tax=Escherichia sp. Marseille-Q3837 TaxID=2866578 RepID=UPI001CE3E471|nr:hypothetical protein [Escherichia sp. Marseille-Q3837]EKK4215227.1 hypothetical protein [Salmonella enterica]HBJ0947140.1 hypothetical protein [Escherichia coli]HCS4677972.1 hypothetical protein [Escherichia coli]HCS4893766.1 hypothetical protein [Escherichia coli]HCS4977530.1 hypothetical protein [Escherichia coli]